MPQQAFTLGNVMNYTYDNIGQLQTAQGYDTPVYEIGEGWVTPPRLQEQFGYAYDAAWNLNARTNNALIQKFAVNTLNELTNATRSGTLTVAGTSTEPGGGYGPYVTNVTVSGTGLSSGLAEIFYDGSWALTNATLANGNNTYTAIAQDTYGRMDTNSITVNLLATNNYSYDLNGNLLSDGTRSFAYDDENELISVWLTNVWRSDYVYDGKMRRRIDREYAWQSSSWMETNETHYVYDGNLVIQERDVNNLPKVTYTRGNDLSGTLQGAGGIGGLLARTDNSQLIIGSSSAHAYYHADGNGNITALINNLQLIVAKYLYDPYGNTLSMSGSLADANVYRFSSKEWNDNAGIYYYLYRYYDPNLQRWPNRDPKRELGFMQLNSDRNLPPMIYEKLKLYPDIQQAFLRLQIEKIVNYSVFPIGADEVPDLYVFANNNSLNEVDPLGLGKWQEIGCAAGATAGALLTCPETGPLAWACAMSWAAMGVACNHVNPCPSSGPPQPRPPTGTHSRL